MARRMTKDDEQEYSQLEAFVGFYATTVWGIDPDSGIHPTNVGRRIMVEVGKSKALAGLRQAANDCLEGIQDLSVEEVAALDAQLEARGILTSTELLYRYSRKYRAVVERGKIRNEAEYHVIAAVASNMAITIDEQERQTLDAMLAGFVR